MFPEDSRGDPYKMNADPPRRIKAITQVKGNTTSPDFFIALDEDGILWKSNDTQAKCKWTKVSPLPSRNEVP